MGKLIAGVIVLAAAIAGVALWYTAERAYYIPASFTPGQEIRLVSVVTGQPEPILVEGIEGIDATSSPIKFRACFTTPLTLALLTETYQIADNAEPLIAPSNFPCFDAKAIGAALETGEAVAFLSEPNITYGIDRIVAITGDGKGYAWHQINACGRVVFNGDPAPEGCPPIPETAAPTGTPEGTN
ncbi:MAG: histidine kinase [Tabrizicola sp.]|nr:histidine kinase [Tabrizicola sp.]